MACKKIPPNRQRFVEEYLLDLNATQAAMRAGYSAKTANEQGARLLANVSVATAIQVAQQKRAKRKQRDADWVIDRLERQSDAAEAAEDFGPAIRATELIGKHLGMFVDRTLSSEVEDGDSAESISRKLDLLATRLHTEPGGEGCS
ncbi:MAG: terminase small subunit [Phycisphaerales bacterium]